jgi:hypothetical protein
MILYEHRLGGGGDIDYTAIFISIYGRKPGCNTFMTKIDIK